MKKSQINQTIKTAKELGVFHPDATPEQLAQRIAEKTGNKIVKSAVENGGFEEFVIPKDFKMGPGRSVDPTSKRQMELKEKHEYRLNRYKEQLRKEGKLSEDEINAITELPEGYVLPKGRPVVEGSKRQEELAKKAGKVSTGARGRSIDPTSKRQMELKLKEARRAKAYIMSQGKSETDANAIVKAKFGVDLSPKIEVTVEPSDVNDETTADVEAEVFEA